MELKGRLRKYKGWIELDTAQFGTYRRSGVNTEEAKKGESTGVNELNVSKGQDAASANLYRESFSGTAKSHDRVCSWQRSSIFDSGAGDHAHYQLQHKRIDRRQ